MTEMFFPGPAGRLEGQYQASNRKNAPIALVIHPNPQMGGTMNNKVVYTMYQAFSSLDYSVLRFNFRGVGKSTGVFDGDPENELADVLAALDWLKFLNPESFECWISGYSFGAMVALQALIRRPDISGFVAVSPPADACAFACPSPIPGLVIHGDMDTVVPEASVASFVKNLKPKPNFPIRYNVVRQAGHLYNGHLRAVFTSIAKNVPELIDSQK